MSDDIEVIRNCLIIGQGNAVVTSDEKNIVKLWSLQSSNHDDTEFGNVGAIKMNNNFNFQMDIDSMI